MVNEPDWSNVLNDNNVDDSFTVFVATFTSLKLKLKSKFISLNPG